MPPFPMAAPDSRPMPEGEPADPPSLAALFEAEEVALLRYAFGLTGRRAVAEEIVQEAFLRLHKHWDKVRTPRPWIYRCVRNLALNELRDTKRERSDDETDKAAAPASEAPDQVLGRMEAIGTLRLLLAELPGEDGQLVRLKYLDHLSYAGIAKKMGMKIGTVGYRLHHILRGLAASLRQAGIDGPAG